MQAELDAALAALEPLIGQAEGEPEPLEGGITNRNFRMRIGGHDVVVRLPGKETELLGIDRAAERDATEAGARAGVGPDVVAHLAAPPCLVTRFATGRQLTAEELRAPAVLSQVAAALRAFHAGPSLPARFDAFAIVDWEYAGVGDRYFDLGNLSVNNGFGEDDDERLLEAYWSEPCTPRRFAALRLMRIMSDFREGMWGVVQTAISTLDFDFAAYGDEHLSRVAAGLADPRVPGWLEDVRG